MHKSSSTQPNTSIHQFERGQSRGRARTGSSKAESDEGDNHYCPGINIVEYVVSTSFLASLSLFHIRTRRCWWDPRLASSNMALYKIDWQCSKVIVKTVTLVAVIATRPGEMVKYFKCTLFYSSEQRHTDSRVRDNFLAIFVQVGAAGSENIP